jgi:hypothetical protein
MDSESFSELDSEVSGLGLGCLLVVLPVGGGFVIEGVVGVGLGQQTLDRQQH